MDKISRHIGYYEATKSDTAARLNLKNQPAPAQLKAMRLLAEKLFEPLREWLRYPIIITSFFRTDEVNKAIGGSNTSQHVKGEAMDMKAPENAGYTNADMFAYIRNKLEFDQLIWEYGDSTNPAWVHVSYSASGNRKQVLRATKINGKTHYTPM